MYVDIIHIVNTGEQGMYLSVIIPTYNRKESLLFTLDSLTQQTYPFDQFEVIVVDDGSNDGTAEVTQRPWPFLLRYLYQENQGGVAARNCGARKAWGDLLVFLDDDMTPLANYLACIARAYEGKEALVARGRLVPWTQVNSVFATVQINEQREPCNEIGCFTSNNLAIRRQAFLDLSGFRNVVPQDTEHKGGLWADLEFAFRALRKGYTFQTVLGAEIIHRDYAILELRVAIRRAILVSRLAVTMLAQYPALITHIPMLHDKGPIVWRKDPPRLILRKLARQVASSPPAMWAMERSVPLLERHAPNSKLLALFYRWIISGYIYRGYREGLRELRSGT